MLIFVCTTFQSLRTLECLSVFYTEHNESIQASTEISAIGLAAEPQSNTASSSTRN
jgi:hypothetical protein